MYKKVRKRKERKRKVFIEKEERDERKSDGAFCSDISALFNSTTTTTTISLLH